jgi:hypothetical protein
VPNESPQQQRATQTREDRDRLQEAAGRLRHRIAQAQYAGLPPSDGDDLLCVATVLDSASMALSELPSQVRRDMLALAGRLLDDGAKLGAVKPLTSGDGV